MILWWIFLYLRSYRCLLLSPWYEFLEVELLNARFALFRGCWHRVAVSGFCQSVLGHALGHRLCLWPCRAVPGGSPSPSGMPCSDLQIFLLVWLFPQIVFLGEGAWVLHRMLVLHEPQQLQILYDSLEESTPESLKVRELGRGRKRGLRCGEGRLGAFQGRWRCKPRIPSAWDYLKIHVQSPSLLPWGFFSIF